ncbi:hypothetical protein PSN45_004829 [Yamadazyma tenuis]|uniref:Phosphodiest-domain-containing protein n=1 Tax=Candida tenuis (strain ATCC 10573 / BCRC 21748 / CBS 615 / JCM 9827 / NBRC 10315 / NRRL Y-1498 / VKM Y-70) TaxID=590646 RepID=G3B1R9_CANTC|nr:uncharacterized protein CANTEDRAFT_120063 [Yamadazyma tenuis ATCC 10573]XP_006685321.1 Phosphodiest-domain-containing protein [Yamadazyma tenuis ATCC 10573]EGV64514.1 hypothetical protein CANTEDRAFT_120063 [Yamadazyma tenuis ATCC 10573]EGV64515.1 Phosphodiest-domain-containing protein [Yamadazyma tenuis ATCC 10573]WEJ97279.1 hypothetical protein PSN45_004829 [Yamadazyma tenuis]
MSINYSVPHRVDIPVTNLDDDSDDDILFNEQIRSRSSSPLPRGDSFSDNTINDLDYEFSTKCTSPFLDRIKGLFGRNNYRHVESYELRDTLDLNDFNLRDDEENLNTRSQTIKRKHFKGLVFFLTTTVVFMTLYFLKGSAGTPAVALKTTYSNTTHSFYPTTIVISLDGFHPHYVSAKLTPSLHDMMMNEYGAPYMIPSFPSSTFPNHWTLVTGLYPSEHGIVGNTFYDPKLKKQFVNTNPKEGGLDPDFWRGGEPIWETAYKQGVNSAVHMWPGSEVPGVGIGNGPLHVDRYNGSEHLSSKVDRVMAWLDVDHISERPELILTYVPTIDSYGHQFGISGPKMRRALASVDDFVNMMRKEITFRSLDDIVNLVIVSDHGMAPTSNNRLLFLDDIIDLSKIQHIDGWPLFGLRPYKEYSVDEIIEELNTNINKLDDSVKNNFDIHTVETLPKEWDFGGDLNDHKFNYRLAPIWIVPKVGYSITTHQQMDEKHNDYTPKGVHGYNNTELLMRAIFLGSGPYFRAKLTGENKRVQPFRNTEVYNLICESLSLKPSPNNGTMDNGYIISAIDERNLLPDEWSEPLSYPNLDYHVDSIVQNATYDLLWRQQVADKSDTHTQSNPKQSLSVEESTLAADLDVSIPKPFDIVSTATKINQITTPTEGPSPGGFLDNLLDQISEVGEGIEDSFEEVGDHLKDTWKDLESFIDGDKNR